ncbi:MAG: hypothetical protein COB67_08275 [SAR324 cluster bacterium]|uniref:Uncharacterized protein n=1 Tax=SAR324 cluster bacterium TaxID=2024889 RepID=A0A2A4T3J8_9DELT|nr:MAG: hypothetical protein COB67_08275 [SAR324 cluster bacterium]
MVLLSRVKAKTVTFYTGSIHNCWWLTVGGWRLAVGGWRLAVNCIVGQAPMPACFHPNTAHLLNDTEHRGLIVTSANKNKINGRRAYAPAFKIDVL